MYKFLLTILVLVVMLTACSKPAATESVEVAEANSDFTFETAALAAANRMEAAEETTSYDDEEMELSFIVSVADGYNYDSLRKIALSSAAFLNFEFDTLGRYYNPLKGIVLPDDDEDEIWAGDYFFRRVGGNMVSLEMLHAYPDTALQKGSIQRKEFYQDSTRMFVFANLYLSKQQADSLQKALKPQFPGARVIASEVYQGCMH